MHNLKSMIKKTKQRENIKEKSKKKIAKQTRKRNMTESDSSNPNPRAISENNTDSSDDVAREMRLQSLPTKTLSIFL